MSMLLRIDMPTSPNELQEAGLDKSKTHRSVFLRIYLGVG